MLRQAPRARRRSGSAASMIVLPLPVLLVVLPFASHATPLSPGDPRERYDVLTYRLDLRVDPERREIAGAVGIELVPRDGALASVELDLAAHATVEAVEWRAGTLEPGSPLAGEGWSFAHEGDRLVGRPSAGGEVRGRGTLVVRYRARPTSFDRFSGVHWKRAESGAPWVDTSCQAVGAHYWWPCKASFFHPEDKCERLWVNLRVPHGLYGVSNGRLVGHAEGPAEDTFHWRHEYPLPTYAVAINVGPFVVTETALELPGYAQPTPFLTYVLPEHAERARVQFVDIPGIVATFSRYFGPYPFPASKVGVVEATFLGMEHATAIAYGSSFPRWRAEQGLEDPLARRNRAFDYILVHELAHEWWGNSVTASDWSDFWLHEGFATYAEAVYVEARDGPEAAQRYLESIAPQVGKGSRLCAEPGSDAGSAYSSALYARGAWVLHTLRHFVDDDEAWWDALRSFQERHRFGTASSEDLRREVERASGRGWSRFFEEWVHGAGFPRIEGAVHAVPGGIRVRIDNDGSDGAGFHVPLDLEWVEDGRTHRERRILEPGWNELEIERDAPVRDLRVVGLERVLGLHRVTAR